MRQSTRYLSVDALRGLIMIIMAIDHSSAFIARQHASEFWAGAMSSYDNAFPFLTRFVTHLCAPGFFFLMGAGIYWFASSGRESGESEWEVIRRTIIRGLVLFLTGQFLETPILYLQNFLKPAEVSLNRITAPPPIDGSGLYWGLITLSGLGLVMVVCGVLLKARPWVWLAVSALCILATNSLLPESGKPGPLWLGVLLAPGLSHHVFVLYPVIPWLAGAAAGMYFAKWWQSNPENAQRRIWVVGLVLVAVSLALRAAGGWGNIRPPRDSGWIEFLNNVKYPPSLVFWTMFLGLDLLLLGVLTRMPESVTSRRSPLIVFGQTPLFFYLAHFYLLITLAFLFFAQPASLAGAYGIWLIVLVLLYPVCAWYRAFKMGKPRGSVWRMF